MEEPWNSLRISWLIEDGNVPTISGGGGSDQLAQPSPSTLNCEMV